MKFLERNLEDIIFETENKLLRERHLYIFGKKLRQVSIGNYGIADLVTISRDVSEEKIIFTVYELKKDVIGVSAFLQAIRYAKGIDSYIVNKRNVWNHEIRIVLIGSEIEKNSDFIYLTDLYDNLNIYIYDYNFDGIIFKQKCGYSLINEGF